MASITSDYCLNETFSSDTGLATYLITLPNNDNIIILSLDCVEAEM